MEIVAVTLFGRARNQVLACLYAQRGDGLHLREIARRTDLSPTAVQHELRVLQEAGLLVQSLDTGRKLYRVDLEHPVAKDLRSVVRKCSAARVASGTPVGTLTLAESKHRQAKRSQQTVD